MAGTMVKYQPINLQRGYPFVQETTVWYKWIMYDIGRSMRYDRNHSHECVRESSAFSFKNRSDSQWRAKLYLNDSPASPRSKDHLSLSITNQLKNEINVNIAIYVLNISSEKVLIHDFSKTFKKDDDTLIDNEFLAKNFLVDNKADLLSADILKLVIKITEIKNSFVPRKTKFMYFSKRPIINDLKKLYNTKLNSDVTVIIEDKRIQAHKSILSARSPVFAAMFTHDMIEKKTNEVTVSDITPTIFEKLLEYIYTDKVSNLSEVAVELVEAAIKYQITSLAKICEEIVGETLNRQNILQRLILADRYDFKDLKDYLIKCISCDLSYILKTNDFKEFEQENLALALELLKNIAVLNSDHTNSLTYGQSTKDSPFKIQDFSI